MAVSNSRKERRSYYSARTGKVSTGGGIDLGALRRAFRPVFDKLEEQGFFLVAFGERLGSGWRPGTLGDVRLHILRRLHKEDLWPVQDHLHRYKEDDLFDIIELMFDHVSKPLKKTQATILGNGPRFHAFDRKVGCREFRAVVNDLLADYKQGYELTSRGEIRAMPAPGMELLMAEKMRHPDSDNVVVRVETAKQKFLRRGGTVEDHRDAVRDLAAVLEYLRPTAKKVLNTKDEADIFRIANEFGIRHHNQQQKTNYDEEIWLSWMFYHFLSTIHACVRLIQKSSSTP